ncbi:MAG: hypothetical protein JW932_09290 [Deltaproteobacteria bacterium]|nr:hypothetical protein [Deltaproteobacteria bacterium]
MNLPGIQYQNLFRLSQVVVIVLLCSTKAYSAHTEDGPVIHIEQARHTFSPVFEGADLAHTFVVSNRGMATLNIKKVTHS